MQSYEVGTHVSFQLQFSKKPPFIKVTRPVRNDREYTPGSRMILNSVIEQVSEVFTIKVRTVSC